MLSFLRKPQIVCHGTKFNVPERHEFWSALYNLAHARFYLVGKTNKSWINKNSEQRDAFAGAILRIISGGGQVRILSEPTEETISDTQYFFSDCLIPELKRLPQLAKEQLVARLERGLVYAVADNSHYRAVVSDDRLVFIPSLNSERFRDEALVFELTRQSFPFGFHTYLSDIERMFDRESKHVPIKWDM
jgi:hypothetical protein